MAAIDDTAPRRFDRRRFLRKVGVTASGAVAAGSAGALGLGEARADDRIRNRGDRFGRMFELRSFADATPAVREALLAFGAKDGPLDARDDMTATPLALILNPGRNPDSSIPAGITFLGQFVDHDVTFDLTSQLGVPTKPEETRNFREPARYYRPKGEAFIPVEFQIAYRLHTLARPSYRANFTGGPGGGPLFLFLFDPSQAGAADPDDLRGGQRSSRRFIDWQTFFRFPGFESSMRNTKMLDRLLSTPLFTLPFGAIATGDQPTALAQRNLLRHLTWSIPSGQAIAAELKAERLGRDDLSELRDFGHELDRSTPLWHYVNAEAELVGSGQRLGPVGGRIVAEVLIGLLELDPGSFLSEKRWRPTLPAVFSGAGEFRMIDFLAFAGVDPTTLAHR